MERISVVGSAAAGKTALARAVAARLRLPYVELDELFWGPNWQEAPTDVFRERVRAATAGDRWVCDGNYSIVRDIVLARADTLVWLDLPFRVVLRRVVRRTVSRAISREQMFSGNVESWRSLLGPKSLIWFTIRTHHGRRARWEAWLRRPVAGSLQVVRLRAAREVERWLASLDQAG